VLDDSGCRGFTVGKHPFLALFGFHLSSATFSALPDPAVHDMISRTFR